MIVFLTVFIVLFFVWLINDNEDNEQIDNMVDSKSTDKLQLLTELAENVAPNVSEMEGFSLTWERFIDDGDIISLPNIEIKKIVFK